MLRLEPALIDVALLAGGVFSSSQAHRVGVSDQELSRAVRLGTVVRVRSGAYALPSVVDGLAPHQRYAVEVRSVVNARPRAWASHHAALAVLCLPIVSTDLARIDVCADVKKSFRCHGVCTSPLPVAEPVTMVDGVRIVSAATAIVQTAAASGVKAGLVAADAALQSRHAGAEDLWEAARRLELGPRQWRRVELVVTLADPAAESPGESLTRLLLHGMGIRFASQVEIRDQSGLIGRVDFLVDEHVVVEFHGMVKYDGADGRAALIREKAREDRLRAAGYEVVRLTWADLRNPAGAGARLEAARRRASARHTR